MVRDLTSQPTRDQQILAPALLPIEDAERGVVDKAPEELREEDKPVDDIEHVLEEAEDQIEETTSECPYDEANLYELCETVDQIRNGILGTLSWVSNRYWGSSSNAQPIMDSLPKQDETPEPHPIQKPAEEKRVEEQPVGEQPVNGFQNIFGSHLLFLGAVWNNGKSAGKFASYLFEVLFSRGESQSETYDKSTGSFTLTFKEENRLPLTQLPEVTDLETLKNLELAKGTDLVIAKVVKGKLVPKSTKIEFEPGSFQVRWKVWGVPVKAELLSIEANEWNENIRIKVRFQSLEGERDICVQDFVNMIEVNLQHSSKKK